MRPVKRPVDDSMPGWPGDSKRPAVATDYHHTSARQAFPATFCSAEVFIF